MNKSVHKNIRRLKGSFLAKGRKFGIVVSEFNEFLTQRLLEGALDTLLRHGANKRDICVVYVPGAFEIPLAVKKLLSKKKLHAVLTLAVVIRGQTLHFEQVARECAKGVREVSLGTEIPVVLGMISAMNESQAIRRVGLKQTNQGRLWTLSAIEMANLVHEKLS